MFWIENPEFSNLISQSWIQNSEFWIRDPEFMIQNVEFWILKRDFRILNSGFRIQSSGFWIVSESHSLIQLWSPALGPSFGSTGPMAHWAHGPHQPSGLMASPLGNIQLQMALSVYIYIYILTSSKCIYSYSWETICCISVRLWLGLVCMAWDYCVRGLRPLPSLAALIEIRYSVHTSPKMTAVQGREGIWLFEVVFSMFFFLSFLLSWLED